jgi:hypothetical protein
MIAGRLLPMSVLSVIAHFHINLLITTAFMSPLLTIVRFDTHTFSMVEDNTIVVLPKKVKSKKYRNIEKPLPTLIECATNLNVVFDEADVSLPARK